MTNARNWKRVGALTRDLRLPVLAAPMFLVSGVDLVLAACRSGIIGSFPAPNARTIEDLDSWCATINAELADADAPWALSLTAHRTYPRLTQELELVAQHRPPVVITALGSPKSVIETVRSYDGLVFADVISIRQARSAVAAGVDALLLVCAGAGGHTGRYSPFAFVEEVRAFWDGPVILSGAVASGRAIAAAQLLGADLVSVGTRFISATESLASAGYQQMVVSSSLEDLVVSDELTGAPAMWLAQSMANALPRKSASGAAVDLSTITGSEQKRWRDIWSAGQGLAGVRSVSDTASIVEQLLDEYNNVLASIAAP